jgi:hypothetical protein
MTNEQIRQWLEESGYIQSSFSSLCEEVLKLRADLAQARRIAEELREALITQKCRCSKAINKRCPQCGESLNAVTNNGPLNDDQFDAIKAGDWYCERCEDGSIRNGKKHWRDKDLEVIVYYQCDRCTALATQLPWRKP